MSREEIHKLVGGYATGTLTPDEREALFAAALEDQELFNALAREQALRDLLSDPAAKAEVLAALAAPPRLRWYERMAWLRPAAVAVAMAGVAVLVVMTWRTKQATPMAGPLRSAPPAVAEVRPAEPPVRELLPAEAPPARNSKARWQAPPPPPPAAAPATVPAPAPAPAPMQAQTQAPMQAQTQAAESTQAQVAVTAGAVSLNAPVMPTGNQLIPSAAQPQFGVRSGGRGGRGGPGGPGGGGGGGTAGPASDAIQLYNMASGMPVAGLGGFRPAAMALQKAQPSNTVALRYSFLRKTAAGEFALASPGELKAGETLEIQFTPAANGYLTVGPEGGKALVAAPVQRLQTVTVPVPEGAAALVVVYSIQPPAMDAAKQDRAVAAPAAAAASGAVAAPEATPQPVKEAVAGVTYVGARTLEGEIRFTIAVK